MRAVGLLLRPTDEVRAQVDVLAPDALDDVLRRAATVGSLDGLFGGRS